MRLRRARLSTLKMTSLGAGVSFKAGPRSHNANVFVRFDRQEMFVASYDDLCKTFDLRALRVLL